MSSIILNPFRLDALFRVYRLSAKRDGADVGGNNNNIDGFSALFFSGAPGKNGGSGLSATELNSIKRLSSAQGRGFLKTLSGIKDFFDDADAVRAMRANAAGLYGCLSAEGACSFGSYISSNLGSRFLLEQERGDISSALETDPALALYLCFRHAYLHLSQVTGIAAVSQYEVAQTQFLNVEARLKICEELAPYNADACAEYADWLSWEKGDRASALRYYSMHPDSNLCLWHTANKLRQSFGPSGFEISDSLFREVKKASARVISSGLKSLSAEQKSELQSMRAKNGSRELKLACEIFFVLAHGHDPFCKACTSLAQMLSTGEISCGDGRDPEEAAAVYYELGIAGGDVTPILNISNHLTSLLANQLIKPIGRDPSVPDLSPRQLQLMESYNSLAADAGFRSCRFARVRISLCKDIMDGKTPDHAGIYGTLLRLEEEDLEMAPGVSRVFLDRSDYWALRGESAPDTDEKIRCLEKALDIEKEKGYDHIPQLCYYLCLAYADRWERDGNGSDAGRAKELLDSGWTALSSDARYTGGIRDLFLRLNG